MTHVYYVGRQDLVVSESCGLFHKVTLKPLITKIHGGPKSFFLTDVNNQVWAFGANWRGQLGLGTQCYFQLIPVKMAIQFKAIYSAENYAYGIAHDGLYSWGQCTYGCTMQTKHSVFPVKVQKGADQVSCQPLVCYIVTDGNLYAQRRLLLKNVLRVATSENHSLCLVEGGQVFAWGIATGGQLGLPILNGQFESYVHHPRLLETLSQIIDVQCGSQYSLALSETGVLFEWGRGQTQLPFEEAIMVRICKREVSEVHSAEHQTACVDNFGRLHIWYDGKPKLVPTGFKVQGVHCGEDITLFLECTDPKKHSQRIRNLVQNRLAQFKEFSELRNSKITQQHYDPIKQRARCVSELNLETLRTESNLVKVEDLGKVVDLVPIKKRYHRRSMTRKLSQEYLEKSPLLVKQMSLRDEVVKQPVAKGKKLKFINFDRVTDVILDSERNFPMYIPFERQRTQPMKKVQAKQKLEKFEGSPTVVDKSIIKYEYINQVGNGYADRLYRSQMKEWEANPISYRRIKSQSTLILDKKYKFMLDTFNKQSKYMKELCQIQDT